MATKDNISSTKDDIKTNKLSLPISNTQQAAAAATETITTTLANNTDETNKVQGAISQVSSSLIKKQNLIPVTLANNRKLTIIKNTALKNGQSVLVKLNNCNKIATSGTTTELSPTTGTITSTATKLPSVTFLTQKLGNTINIRSATGSTIIKTNNIKQGQTLENKPFIPITIKGNTTIKRFPTSLSTTATTTKTISTTQANLINQSDSSRKSLITLKQLPSQSLVVSNNPTNVKSMSFKPVSFRGQPIKGPILSLMQQETKILNTASPTVMNREKPELKKGQIFDLTVDTGNNKSETKSDESNSLSKFENKKIFIKTTSKNYNKFLMGKNFDIKKCKMINIKNGKISTAIDKDSVDLKNAKKDEIVNENKDEGNKLVEIIEIEDDKNETMNDGKNNDSALQDVFEIFEDSKNCKLNNENKKENINKALEKHDDMSKRDEKDMSKKPETITDEKLKQNTSDNKLSPLIRVKNVESLCKARVLKRSASLQDEKIQNKNINKVRESDIDSKLYRSFSISNINESKKDTNISYLNENNDTNDTELTYNELRISNLINNNGDLISVNKQIKKIISKDNQNKNNFDTMMTSCFDEIYGNVIIPDDDLYDYINWIDGVGYLHKSDLHFQYNEFGLIELMNDKEYKKNKINNINNIYSKPIYERDIKPYDKNCTEKLYSCKLCSCHGFAVDFLVPDFCSKICLYKYKQRVISADYTNNNTNDKIGNQLVKNSKSIIKNIFYKPSTPTTSSDSSSFNYTSQCSENEIDDENNSNVSFDWDSYFTYIGTSYPAPLYLFINPYPSNENHFMRGMKLEAIDPVQCNLFCVATVINILGYRIKLHFDGYHYKYDFWVNADSLDIFPPNWCNSTKRKLQVPKIFKDKFNWDTYLKITYSIGAPRNLFTHLNSTTSKNPFKCGMKLEANDIKNSGKICVATITDIIDHRVLVHFDGWDHCYDYWTTYTSPHLHPINFFRQNGATLIMPPGWKGAYSWKSYLAQTNTSPTPDSIFCTRNAIPFKAGMKIEVVDKKIPSIIRLATIILVDNYEIKILYDGWPATYAYWLDDDNQDIHPIKWCKLTNHPIEYPLDYKDNLFKKVCLTNGCRGIGNANEAKSFHDKYKDCPYEEHNWKNNVQANRFDIKTNLEDLESSNENDENLTLHEMALNAKRKSSKRLRDCSPEKKKSSNDLGDIPMTRERKLLKTYSNNNSDKNTNANNIINIALNSNKTNNDNINDDNSIPTDININATKNLLDDYGPSILKEKYMLWKKNSKILNYNLNDNIQKNPLKWTVDEVCNYISNIPNCSHLSYKFLEQEIDGMALLNICQNDLLKHLNIRLGPSIKIYNQIVRLREQVAVNFLKI